MAKRVLSDLAVDGTVSANEVTAGTHKLTDKLNVTATAVRATGDASGNTITSTYATKSELSSGLGEKLDIETAASTYATQTALSTHTGNTTVHITATERQTWNGALSAAEAEETYATKSDVDSVESRVTTLEDGTVKTTGDQTVAGVKTFTDGMQVFENPTINTRHTSLTLNDTPTTNTRVGAIRMHEGDGELISALETFYSTDERVETNVYARNRQSDGTFLTATLSCRAYKDGRTFAYAPATPAFADGTEIATANWVNDKVDGKADASDVSALTTRVSTVEGEVSALETGTVKLAGTQTITGRKTFTNYPIVTNSWALLSRNDGYTIGADTSYTARHIRFVDANDDLMTSIRSEANGNAADASRVNDTVICNYGPNGKTCELRLRITDSGEAQALLTQPAADCKDSQIVTARWVNDKLDGTVKTTGDQHIEGIKYFDTITGVTLMAQELSYNDVVFMGSDNKRLGIIRANDYENRHTIQMAVFPPGSNSHSGSNNISLSCLEDGTLATTCPAPPANADGAQIATAGWVNDKIDTRVPLAGGTMTGRLTAQNNTSYTTKQVRNITISTASPSGGGNGDVWLKYK